MTMPPDLERAVERLIRPCPFCGDVPMRMEWTNHVICRTCDIAKDIDVWNRRVATEAEANLIVALKEREAELSSLRGAQAVPARHPVSDMNPDWNEPPVHAEIGRTRRLVHIPPGFVVVPVEPTEEMLQAGCNALDMWVKGWQEKLYAAWIAAAPNSLSARPDCGRKEEHGNDDVYEYPIGRGVPRGGCHDG